MYDFKVGDIVSHHFNTRFQNGIIEVFDDAWETASVYWPERHVRVWHPKVSLRFIRRPLTESEIKSLKEDV